MHPPCLQMQLPAERPCPWHCLQDGPVWPAAPTSCTCLPSGCCAAGLQPADYNDHSVQHQQQWGHFGPAATCKPLIHSAWDGHQHRECSPLSTLHLNHTVAQLPGTLTLPAGYPQDGHALQHQARGTRPASGAYRQRTRACRPSRALPGLGPLRQLWADHLVSSHVLPAASAQHLPQSQGG